MFLYIFALCVLSLNFCSGTKYSVRDSQIIDEYGRQCYFHGVNVVYKSPPYIPVVDHFDANLSFSTQDMELLSSLGLNVIRLGVMWPGVEPYTRGGYDYDYIGNISTLIKTAYEQYGIHTLVDAHQDVLSECFCGEGGPIWAMSPTEWNFPEPRASAYVVNSSDHIPSRQDCLSEEWPGYYTTEAASSAFQSIYSNKNGLADAFADFWGVLANSMSQVPGIIGFELINEPWPGDIFKDPLLMVPGNADERNLQPFYDRIAPRIYDNDSNRMIFFESIIWTGEFNVSSTEAGFSHVPGGEEYAEQSVFSFHYYDPPNIGPIEDYFFERVHDAYSWNCAAFLTEFDISNDHSLTPVFDKQSRVMQVCDHFKISWIGWEYKPLAGSLPNGTCTGCNYGIFLPDGSINAMVSKAVSRTYTQFVSGTLESMVFDTDTAEFTMSFVLNTSIAQPTVVYANLKYWYPQGYSLLYSPTYAIASITTSSDGQYTFLFNTQNTSLDATLVTITVTPK